MSRILTRHEVALLAQILVAASNGDRVRYAQSDGEIKTGTARHLVLSPDHPVFLGSQDDVRDAYLRVTLSSGFEDYWPIEDVVRRLQDGLLAFDPR